MMQRAQRGLPDISRPYAFRSGLVVGFHNGYVEDYNAQDFEYAAKRLLGDRYLELTALSATPAQLCNEFSQAFFSGALTETPDNSDDITLMLTASTDIFVGRGLLEPNDSEPAVLPKEAGSLAELLRSDIAPDGR